MGLPLDPRNLDGNSWENLCQSGIFPQKYSDYQEIPSEKKGDFGLEGFTLSGLAFQCYCPDYINSNIGTIYKNQRNKITEDINKFVNNKSNLELIFGKKSIKIRMWCLVTPIFYDDRLIKHCRKKEKEVIKENLNYTDDDFKIVIFTLKTYSKEISEYLISSDNKISLPLSTEDLLPVDDWINQNNQHYLIVSNKLRKTKIPEKQIHEITAHYLKMYLIGNQLLETILQNYPRLYQNIIALKSYLADEITAFSGTAGTPPGDHLQNCFKDYNRLLMDKIGSTFHEEQLRQISFEAIGEWLINTTLNFG